MKQARATSLIEAVSNTVVGFGLAFAANALLLPLFGFPITVGQNLIFGVLFTAISVVRQYAMRRLFEALHLRVPLSPAAIAILAERRRQVEDEGWTAEHDDSHRPGELAAAGACYALYGRSEWLRTMGVGASAPSIWPWSADWWKPQGARRDLVRAGALILAELERHDRAGRRGQLRNLPGGYSAPDGPRPDLPTTGSGVVSWVRPDDQRGVALNNRGSS